MKDVQVKDKVKHVWVTLSFNQLVQLAFKIKGIEASPESEGHNQMGTFLCCGCCDQTDSESFWPSRKAT